MTEGLKPGWRRVKIGDVVQRHVQRCHDAQIRHYEYFIGVDDLDPGDLKLRRWGSITNEGLPPTFRYAFPQGSVLFPTRRPVLNKLAVAPFDGLTGEKILVLVPRNPSALDPAFLPFLLSSEKARKWVVTRAIGSVTPHFRWRDLADYEFALPPPEEQRRIVRLLQLSARSIEAAEDAVKKTTTLLRSYREHQLASGHSVSFEDVIARIEAGKSLAGENQSPGANEYGVLKVSAVGPTVFLPSEAKRLIHQHAFLPAQKVRRGDLLITRANTPDLVGMSCLVDRDYPNLMLCDKTLRLVPREGRQPQLILMSLWTVDVRRQLKAFASGTGAAMKNISQKKLRLLKLPWPRSHDAESAFLKLVNMQQSALSEAQSRFEQTRKVHRIIVNGVLAGNAA